MNIKEIVKKYLEEMDMADYLLVEYVAARLMI